MEEMKKVLFKEFILYKEQLDLKEITEKDFIKKTQNSISASLDYAYLIGLSNERNKIKKKLLDFVF
jgi:hypothetical protein